MFYNSRGVALLLASSIAIVTASFLSLVEDVTSTAIFVAFILSFSSSYILINLVLEFLIFKEINNIYGALNKLKKKDFSFSEQEVKTSLNPIKRINHEIYSYASGKQREIEELKKLAAFRREFLADVSHELKTPIFAAQGFVHTLLDGAADDLEVRDKFLKKAAKSLDGLDILVQDLLTLSRMESGDIVMRKQHFDIREMVEEVFEQLEGKAEKRGISFMIAKEAPASVMVYADQDRINQVMVNLISNAIKYNKDDGQVLISFESAKNNIRISVKDSGKGIPPEHLKRIFERFYRVEKSRSKDKGGTGLGLAIVKHIVEAHNTQVAVTSSEGKGSTFSFSLPKKPKKI